MSNSFDAYHVWLGIPAYDQPPNHYRLLGLEAFEENADAIANSADRQMAHIRSVSSGENADRGQQLLNEIADARGVLLNEARKKAYDTKLKADFRQYDLAGDVPLSIAVDDLADSDIRGRVELLSKAENELWNDKQERAQQEVGYIYGIGGILAVIIAVVIAVPIMWRLGASSERQEQASGDGGIGEGSEVAMNSGSAKTAVGQADGATVRPSGAPDSQVIVGAPQKADGSAAPDKTAENASTEASKPAAKPGPTIVPGLPPGTVAQSPTAPGAFNPGAGLGATPGLSRDSQTNQAGGLGGSPTGQGTQPAKANSAAAAKRDDFLKQAQAARGGYVPKAPQVGPTQQAKTKVAIPTAAEYKTATEEVRAAYKADFEKARNIVDRRKLAYFLFSEIKTLGNDHASKYALLKIAQDLAAKTGQVKLAFDCLQQISIGYEVDAVEERRALVVQLAERKTMDNDQRKILVTNALNSYKELKLEKRYEDAHEVAGSARTQALTAKDTTLRVKAQRIFAEANSMARMKTDHDDALKTLAETPDDPVANRNVGLYLCLIQEQWTTGLPRLAKAKSALLAAAAKLDMATPQTGDEMVKVGDAWKAAAALKGNELFRDRAMHWYMQAAPMLDGLQRGALDRKIREIRDAGI